MPAARLFVGSSLVLAAAAALAACAPQGGAGGAGLPVTPLALQRNVVLGDAGAPAPCTGQKTTKNYAKATVTLETTGGKFCVPAFGGFGGTIAYPKAKPKVNVTLTSSTTDYNKLPQLGTGTAIFYLQMNLLTHSTFGNAIDAAGGLTAATIKSGKTYTAYGQASLYGSTIKFGPCFEVATKGKYGGVLSSLGALLEYAVVPAKTKGFLEVYAGKQSKNKC